VIILLLFSANTFAQTPVISNISPINTYPKGKIVITGNGFSSVTTALQVWFGPVKGSIVSSSPYSIEVEVPAQARYSTIEVVNLTSGLAAKSSLKFLPSFYGEPFDVAKFNAPLSFPSNEEVWDLCSCDLDNDLKPDLLATKFVSPANDLVILKNSSTPGNIAFTETHYLLSFASDHISCGDLNGDGKPDVVVTRSGAPRNSVHIIQNTSITGSINLSPTPINLFMDNGHFATRTALHDLNRDGKPEIIVSNSFNNALYVFINESTAGTIAFNATPVKVTVTGATNTYGLEVADVNGDKLPDIIVTQFQSNHIFILKNESTGNVNFAEPFKINVFGNLNKLTTADFNSDGKSDLAVTSTLTNEVVLLFNQSSTSAFSFAAPVALNTGNGPWGIDVSDIDGDRSPDIIVSNRNQTVLDVFIHNGSTHTGITRSTIATTRFTRNILAGDLDGDAKPDLAFTSFSAPNNYALDILRNTHCHKPLILNKAPLEICNGQTIRLNAIPSPGITFTWKEGTNIIKSGPDNYVDITLPGSYTVTAEQGSCALSSSVITITPNAATIPENPAVTSTSPLCSGSNLQLTTPIVAGATYAWTGPNGFTSTSQSPVIIAATETDAGPYTLEVSVGNCKSNIMQKVIEVVSIDDFTINSTNTQNTICAGQSLTLNVNNLPGYSFQWKKNGTDIIGQQTSSLVVNEENIFSVVVTNMALGCSKEIGPVAVIALTAPTADFHMPLTACANSSVTFTNHSLNIDPRATTIYSWSFGGGKTYSGSAPPAQVYTAAGIYNVTLSLNYSGISGCTSATAPKTLTITNATAPVITATPALICPGEITSLAVQGTYTSVLWSTGETGTSIIVNQPGNYTVTATGPAGCVMNKDFNLLAKEIPVITIEADDLEIYPGEQVQLQANGAHTYSWFPVNSLNNPTDPAPFASPSTTTTYTVVGDLIGGCSAQQEVTVVVNAAKLNIKPPLAFSPNGDNSNDTWIIEGVEEFPACTMNVFDGRGRRIYQKKGYNNDWDGTHNGNPVPAGTYYYVFGCPDASATGSVLIFR